MNAPVGYVPREAVELVAHIGRITTPSNFTLTARYDALRNVVALGITAHWPDIDGPRIVQTHIERPIPLEIITDTTILNHLVFDAIHTLWDHELHEHVRYDGVPIIDPHPDGGFR